MNIYILYIKFILMKGIRYISNVIYLFTLRTLIALCTCISLKNHTQRSVTMLYLTEIDSRQNQNQELRKNRGAIEKVVISIKQLKKIS